MKKRTLDRMILMLSLMAVIVLVLAVSGLMALLGDRNQEEITLPVNPVATAAPDIEPADTAMYQVYEGELMRQDGSSLSLAELRGNRVMLVFWSSWCADCKDYMQGDMPSALEAARALGMQAYLVCREGRHGESWETALACLEEMNIAESTLMDKDAALYERMGLRWVPTVVLLNEEGRLVAATTRMPGAQEVQAMAEAAAGGHQAQSERFLRERLLTASGAVPSTYFAAGSTVQHGGDVLSETQGLMMLYAAQAGDKALFDTLLSCVRNQMTVNGLTAWRSMAGVNADVNAALDDLRILEALSLAEETWGGYTQELGYRASALYRRCVKDGHLRDYVTLTGGEAINTQTLCYLDVAAMERAAGAYGKWAEAAQTARQVLAGGVISDKFPLYYPKYDPEKGQYWGDSLQMNEALVTVYHAAKAGLDVSAALNWLEAELKEGGIYARYDLRGDPVRGYLYESTATYALLAQAAVAADRDDLAQLALARMERSRCYTEPMAGDMGRVTDESHNVFDLTQALLAWQAWNGREGTP